MSNEQIDQHLIDYTVRNITTGDEEDIRVLELADGEIQGFPEAVREQIRTIIRAQSYATPEGVTTGHIQTTWADDQEKIRDMLMPYISRPELYAHDYAAWEDMVLGEPITDEYPPEDVADRVRAILYQAVDSAVENWAEGHWDEFSTRMSVTGVLEYFVGYLNTVTESPFADDAYLPFMQANS